MILKYIKNDSENDVDEERDENYETESLKYRKHSSIAMIEEVNAFSKDIHKESITRRTIEAKLKAYKKKSVNIVRNQRNIKPNTIYQENFGTKYKQPVIHTKEQITIKEQKMMVTTDKTYDFIEDTLSYDELNDTERTMTKNSEKNSWNSDFGADKFDRNIYSHNPDLSEEKISSNTFFRNGNKYIHIVNDLAEGKVSKNTYTEKNDNFEVENYSQYTFWTVEKLQNVTEYTNYDDLHTDRYVDLEVTEIMNLVYNDTEVLYNKTERKDMKSFYQIPEVIDQNSVLFLWGKGDKAVESYNHFLFESRWNIYNPSNRCTSDAVASLSPDYLSSILLMGVSRCFVGLVITFVGLFIITVNLRKMCFFSRPVQKITLLKIIARILLILSVIGGIMGLMGTFYTGFFAIENGLTDSLFSIDDVEYQRFRNLWNKTVRFQRYVDSLQAMFPEFINLMHQIRSEMTNKYVKNDQILKNKSKLMVKEIRKYYDLGQQELTQLIALRDLSRMLMTTYLVCVALAVTFWLEAIIIPLLMLLIMRRYTARRLAWLKRLRITALYFVAALWIAGGFWVICFCFVYDVHVNNLRAKPYRAGHEPKSPLIRWAKDYLDIDYEITAKYLTCKPDVGRKLKLVVGLNALDIASMDAAQTYNYVRAQLPYAIKSDTDPVSWHDYSSMRDHIKLLQDCKQSSDFEVAFTTLSKCWVAYGILCMWKAAEYEAIVLTTALITICFLRSYQTSFCTRLACARISSDQTSKEISGQIDLQDTSRSSVLSTQ